MMQYKNRVPNFLQIIIWVYLEASFGFHDEASAITSDECLKLASQERFEHTRTASFAKARHSSDVVTLASLIVHLLWSNYSLGFHDVSHTHTTGVQKKYMTTEILHV